MMLGRAKLFGYALQIALHQTISLQPAIMTRRFMASTAVKNKMLIFPFRNLSTSGDADKAHAKLIEEVEEASYRLLYVALPEQVKADLSALFMQLTEGKCTEPEPRRPKTLEMGFWRDWKKLGDMPREEAARKYMEIAKKYMR